MRKIAVQKLIGTLVMLLFALLASFLHLKQFDKEEEQHTSSMEELTAFRIHADNPAYTGANADVFNCQRRVLIFGIGNGLQYILKTKIQYIYLITDIIFCFSAMIFFRKWMRRFVPNVAATLGSIGIPYALSWNLIALSFDLYMPCDIPAVFFFTAGLYFLSEKKWVWYYGFFIVGCFNKESIAFLTVVMLLVEWNQMKLPMLATHLASQFIIWVTIYIALKTLFPSHETWIKGERIIRVSGDSLMSLYHIITLKPYALKLSLLNSGALWITALLLLPLAPAYLKRMSLVTIPFLFAGLIFFNLLEARDYSEIISVLLAPTVYGLYTLAAEDMRAETSEMSTKS